MRKSTVFIGLCVSIFISCGTGRNSKSPDNLLPYEIYSDEIMDTPGKTQISLAVVIKERFFGEERLRELLTYLYNKSISKSGFKFHDSPNSVFIWAYTSEEKASSGLGQWIGMISKRPNQSESVIYIGESQFRGMSQSQEAKWGIGFLKRQEIWAKMIEIERKAEMEAKKKYPIDDPDLGPKNTIRNIEFMRKRTEDYEAELIRDHGIKQAILDSISIEGIHYGWAFP